MNEPVRQLDQGVSGGNSDYARIARAISYLTTHAGEQPGLADLAAHLNLSAFHFQRLFHRWAGVTPKEFLQLLTFQRAKALLANAHSLLDTSLEVGLSGSSRLHDLFLSLEAMTPGEFKRRAHAVEIRWGVHATPYGHALLAMTERGICGLSFLEADRRRNKDTALAALRSRWPEAILREDAAQTAASAAEISARMRGRPGEPLALLLRGTPFQTKVWQALLAVPEGQVCTYQGLASLAGAPGAARAVGVAMATNPIGYLIPCHRVIRATGVIGDYQWGTTRKQVLLATERNRRAGARSAAYPGVQTRSTRQL